MTPLLKAQSDTQPAVTSKASLADSASPIDVCELLKHYHCSQKGILVSVLHLLDQTSINSADHNPFNHNTRTQGRPRRGLEPDVPQD